MKKWLIIIGAIVIAILSVIIIVVINRPTGTSEINLDASDVIKSIERLALLQTSRYNIDTVVTNERDTEAWNAFLVGDKLLYVASGFVTAGIDFSLITEEAVQITDQDSDSRRIELTLPAPQLIDCALDVYKSYVYEREHAAFAYNPNLETETMRAALDEIQQAALEAGILDTAKEQAEAIITVLLYSLEFEDVEITFSEDSQNNVSTTCVGS